MMTTILSIQIFAVDYFISNFIFAQGRKGTFGAHLKLFRLPKESGCPKLFVFLISFLGRFSLESKTFQEDENII